MNRYRVTGTISADGIFERRQPVSRILDAWDEEEAASEVLRKFIEQEDYRSGDCEWLKPPTVTLIPVDQIMAELPESVAPRLPGF